MLPRIEHSVVVPVSREVAFQAFQDLERLLHRGIYEEVSWVDGAPWGVGSRVRYVVSKPIQATISGVVTSCDPPNFVAMLNHALGVTTEQQVWFAAAVKGGTRVRMTMDFVGKSTELSDKEVREAISFYTHDALDSMGALCRRWQSASSS
ncbi:MAG TPA: SRPBCC family protein [Terriglobales bacterium]|nr:SRPBCC family protein [Terriglobales bacterium]